MSRNKSSSAHLTHPYLLNPEHKVTINLIGAGGTGCQVLSALGRMHKGLQAMGHTGLHVRLYDFDTVSDANIGRQLFSPVDIGMNKAVSSITRINRYFGYEWEAVPKAYTHKSEPYNITISCIDTAEGRLRIAEWLNLRYNNDAEPFHNKHYWLDFGNGKVTGQVILGTIDEKRNNALPTVTELFDLTQIKEEDQGPSCSLAEAIGRQDLFINSTLANLGCNLLWKLFTDGKINYHGIYLNLESMRVQPIMIEHKPIIKLKKTKKTTV